ncbi:3-oxoacyl-ACP reductase [Actinacidiphila bryophytorum]|uniref:3-oxoacyl-(Acyl-carrier-protein) reductase (NADH) n=1 Tax=Actinacidiphila bryophytorum TaxID=1436133 RepID=A0A9W4E114_9ACTN|nr:3-oxoacyl-ACP reductase [Actinacidiphila bryophytorum]MBM9439011.1 3-oxoacyl-ACP reductase [Actinacidiphila bryophytorum]MBN6547887.1 3-oxoacyl-ACP reductase [Actinacidiphila bryophytorum]CAG7597340.1 3-oxoacyl-(acyl-carrier-protein) reductase (NADH) [Actinacidiphila bryophytorum]
MADRYLRLTGTAPGRFVTRRLGLPQPAALRRWSPQTPDLPGPVLRLTAGETPQPGTYGGIVLDATAVTDPADLQDVHTALHPLARSLTPCGRIVVLGARPQDGDLAHAAAQQALEGFVRSLGKEIGRGSTVQLVRLAPGAAAESTLDFLLSPRSAYVSGQVVEVGPAPEVPAGGTRTALVTGAARGIGLAVAETLVRDGAQVVLLDVPQAADALTRAAARLGGSALPLDVTAPDAGERIAAALPDGLDVLVHNAGITRDRRLANMSADRWDTVIDVNLGSVLRTTGHLLKAGTLNEHARIVGTASIAGIAGNVGQTNYAASKAGIIGYVRALAADAEVRERGITANAVAPGFIETTMTAAVPLVIREAGRRMNSLAQGGQPVDVAETVAWLAAAGSGGVNGQVVRVCGQSLLGA